MSRSSSPFLPTSRTRSVQDSSAFRLVAGRLTAFAFAFSFSCVALRPLPIAALHVLIAAWCVASFVAARWFDFCFAARYFVFFVAACWVAPIFAARWFVFCFAARYSVFFFAARCFVFFATRWCFVVFPFRFWCGSFIPIYIPLSLTTLGVNIEYFTLAKNVFL